jgi:hypothetical protein
MSLVGEQIRSFSQSLEVLLGIEHRFRRVHAVMLLDADSRVVDGFAFTSRHATAEQAAEAGLVVGTSHGVIRRALLLSAGVAPVVVVEEADLQLWRDFVDDFAAVGIELLDWLASDGDNIRSFAITTDAARAWAAT